MLNEFKLTIRVFVLQIQIHPMKLSLSLGGLLLARTHLIYLAKQLLAHYMISLMKKNYSRIK